MEEIGCKPPIIKVANIIEEARWGGPQKRIILVSKKLQKLFLVETVVLLPKSIDKYFLSQLKENGLSHREVSLTPINRSALSILLYLVNFIPDIYRLAKALKSEKFDLVHASGGAWQLKGVIAARIINLPVIWHLNDTSVPLFYLIAFKFLKKLANSYILSADRVFGYYFPTKTNKRIFTISPPVDTNLMVRNNFVSHQDMRVYEGVKIVSVCNINPNKGLEILIDAVKILSDKGLIFKLFIAGPVYESQLHYSQFLIKKVERYDLSNRIHFMGPQRNVGAILAGADIFVCSSYSETGPMSLWEALSMNCAVLSTDVGDLKKYILHGVNGYIVPAGDLNQLANFLEKLICNPHLRVKFSNASRAIALKVDVKQCALKTYQAYTNTLGELVKNVQR